MQAIARTDRAHPGENVAKASGVASDRACRDDRRRPPRSGDRHRGGCRGVWVLAPTSTPSAVRIGRYHLYSTEWPERRVGSSQGRRGPRKGGRHAVQPAAFCPRSTPAARRPRQRSPLRTRSGWPPEPPVREVWLRSSRWPGMEARWTVSPFPNCPGSVCVYGPEPGAKVKATPHASWEIPPDRNPLSPRRCGAREDRL